MHDHWLEVICIKSSFGYGRTYTRAIEIWRKAEDLEQNMKNTILWKNVASRGSDFEEVASERHQSLKTLKDTSNFVVLWRCHYWTHHVQKQTKNFKGKWNETNNYFWSKRISKCLFNDINQIKKHSNVYDQAS